MFFLGEAPSDAVNDDDNLDNRGEEKLKKQLSDEGEGKSKEEDKKTPGDEPGEGVSTKYRLRGIVVHSGQASGGHYYSFIQIRCGIFRNVDIRVLCSGNLPSPAVIIML